MTILTELLERAGRGELGDIWQADMPSVQRVSSGTKRLGEMNSALDILLEADARPAYDDLVSMQCRSSYDAMRLAAISSSARRYIEAADNFLAFGYNNPEGLKKACQAGALANEAKSALCKAANAYHSDFCSKRQEMEQRKLDLDSCRQIRKALSVIADSFFLVRKEALAFGARIDDAVAAQFAAYSEKQERINDSEKQIQMLMHRYLSMHLNSDPERELAEIKSKTKSGWMRKSSLVKECAEVGYFEGLIELDELNKDASAVGRDLIRYISIRKNIEEDCDALKRYVSQLEKDTSHSRNFLDGLLGEFGADKYRDVQGLMLFREKAAEYSAQLGSLQMLVSAAARKLDEKEKDKEIDQYKSAVEQMTQRFHDAEATYQARIQELGKKAEEAESCARLSNVRISEGRELAARYKADMDSLRGEMANATRQYQDDVSKLRESMESVQREAEQYRHQAEELGKRAEQSAPVATSARNQPAIDINIIENPSAGFFIDDYLCQAPQPKTYMLRKLGDILNGDNGETDMFARFQRFSDYISSLSPSRAEKDRKYVAFLFEGIKKEASEGFSSKALKSSTYRRNALADTLANCREYLERCEAAR